MGNKSSKKEKNDAPPKKKEGVDKKKQKEVEEAQHPPLKVILLGAGESGKSTVAKQMKILHRDGFTDEEKQNYKAPILQGLMSCIMTLITAARNLNIPILEETAERILAEDTFNVVLTPTLVEDIKTMWATEGIQEVYGRRREFQLMHSAKYFMENVERIANPRYVPNVQDIVRARVRTTGIVEINLSVQNRPINLFDMGGQRSERKKWIHIFKDVTAVVFCVSLDGYAYRLFEDDSTNRMTEALALWGEICKSEWFMKSQFILWFTKEDTMDELLKRVTPSEVFEEYSGGSDKTKALEFIAEQFVAKNAVVPDRKVHVCYTNSTDTESVKKNWTESIEDLIDSVSPP